MRSFTYIDDTIDGVVRALQTPEARGEVLNVGGATPTTIQALAGLVQQTLGIPQPLRARFVPYESLGGNYQDVLYRIPDITKARDLIGFEAKVSLAEGLALTAEWHRDRRLAQQQVVVG